MRENERVRTRLRNIITHYIQKIDIVDTTTDETVEALTAFDTDGREAARQAWQLAFEAIRRRHQE